MSKSNSNRDRREQVEQMRRDARAKERRRTLVIVAACVAVALIIIGGVVYTYLQEQDEKNALRDSALDDIGADAESARCAAIEEEDASGAGNHTTDRVDYDVQPPSFGPHNPSPADLGIHQYDETDRPETERLVHNLEHGWTIVWYDDTVADDSEQMKVLDATADKFDAEGNNPEFNMIIAPWTSDDGSEIPDGKHIALTHWSIHQPVYDEKNYQDEPPSFGVSQYCDSFSGGVLDDFMTEYPYDDAPEGYLWHQSGG